MPEQAARRYVVHGAVQGVGFRQFVFRAATELGVHGTVGNRDDGSVEVLAVGTPKQLANLAGRLHQGPPASHVRRVEEHQAPMQQYGSFVIAH